MLPNSLEVAWDIDVMDGSEMNGRYGQVSKARTLIQVGLVCPGGLICSQHDGVERYDVISGPAISLLWGIDSDQSLANRAATSAEQQGAVGLGR